MADPNHHEGDIIPNADKRVYSYQGESILIRGQVSAFESNHLDTHEWKDRQDCRQMKLEITRGTERSVDVALVVMPTNNEFIEQRVKDGAGVIQTKYWTCMSFGELVNRIFGPGCQVFVYREAFPDKVKEVMKTCYQK